MSISYRVKIGNTDKNHQSDLPVPRPLRCSQPPIYIRRNKNSKYFPPDNGIKSNFSRIHLHRNLFYVLQAILVSLLFYLCNFLFCLSPNLLFYPCYINSNSVTAFQVTNVSMLLRLLPSVQILNQESVADMTAKTVQNESTICLHLLIITHRVFGH